MDLFQLTAAAIGAIAALFAIFSGIRNKQHVRPELNFDFAITRFYRKRIFRSSRNLPCNTLVQILPLEKEGEHSAYAPFFVENISKKSVRDVVVQLEYPSCFYISDIESHLEKFNSLVRFKKKVLETRNSTVISSYINCRHELGTLTPGEKRVIAEPLLVRWPYQFTTPHKNANFVRANIFLENELDGFLGLCPIRSWVYSEDSEPIEKDVTVYWTLGDSFESGAKFFENILHVLWGGKYPSKGLLIKYPWETNIKNELIQYNLPKFGRINLSESIEVDAMDAKLETGVFTSPQKGRFGNMHVF